MEECLAGSDGGGSIRCPAHYCGLVGLKPSHGRIPRDDGNSDRSEGLPVGLLITARSQRDDVVLRLARILERESPWPLRPPGW